MLATISFIYKLYNVNFSKKWRNCGSILVAAATSASCRGGGGRGTGSLALWGSSLNNNNNNNSSNINNISNKHHLTNIEFCEHQLNGQTGSDGGGRNGVHLLDSSNLEPLEEPQPIKPKSIVLPDDWTRKPTKVRDSSSDSKPPLRWGIAPASRIGHDFAQALSILPESQHRLVACAAPYQSQVDEFAGKFNVAKKFTSFLELARCNSVDVVYVAPLTPMHLELGRLMLSNGKHVVCEPPFCINERQALEMIGYSEFERRFLMEAQWSRFMPSYRYIRHMVLGGAVGVVNEMYCTLGVPMTDVERVKRRSLGGGATLELGPAAIQFVLWIFRMQPFGVRATGVLNEDGVDTQVRIDMDFCCGRKATVQLSTEDAYDNCARIMGHTGVMTIPSFICPSAVKYNTELKTFNVPLDENLYSTNYPQRLAMCYQADEVRRCIMDEKFESSIMGHNETLGIKRICDEVRRQLGVAYAEDSNVANQIQPDAFGTLHEHITI